MKKIPFFCATLLLSLILTQIAAAQMNTSLFIEKIEYKRGGAVVIEFDDNTVKDPSINWTGREAVTVFDKNGEKIDSAIEARGIDWLRIQSKQISNDETYTFEIRNVSYASRKDIFYSGFFISSPGWEIEYKEPPRFRQLHRQAGSSASDIFIRDVEYDRGGRLEITFASRVDKKTNIEWNGSEKIKVTDETGRAYEVKIEEYERNKIEIWIVDAVENMNYTLEVSGVPFDGERLSFRVDFVARNDWRFRPPHARPK